MNADRRYAGDGLPNASRRVTTRHDPPTGRPPAPSPGPTRSAPTGRADRREGA